MSILLFWIGAVVLFLIMEMLTATFYGLSLALASTIVATYVYFMGEAVFSITQWLIFVLASLLFAYILPKVLVSNTPDVPQWVDKYLGQVRSVKKVGGEWKISLDGVDYAIETDDEISQGNKVEVIGHGGASMKVKKVG